MMVRWIKEYYDKGLYSDAQLDLFVNAHMITQEEADEIKGISHE